MRQCAVPVKCFILNASAFPQHGRPCKWIPLAYLNWLLKSAMRHLQLCVELFNGCKSPLFLLIYLRIELRELSTWRIFADMCYREIKKWFPKVSVEQQLIYKSTWLFACLFVFCEVSHLSKDVILNIKKNDKMDLQPCLAILQVSWFFLCPHLQQSASLQTLLGEMGTVVSLTIG